MDVDGGLSIQQCAIRCGRYRCQDWEKDNFEMKKLVIGGVVAIAALGGGYVFLSNSAQSAAKDAIATIEKEIEAGVPKSDFTFGEVKADVFSNSATVSDLALKIDGTPLLTAEALVIAGDDVTLKRAELIGIEGSYAAAGDKVTYGASSFDLGDADIAALKAFIEAAKADPAGAIASLNTLSIGEFALADLSIKGIDRSGREALVITGQIQISGVKGGAVETLSVAGTLEDKLGSVNGNAFKSDLKKFNMSGLRFADLFDALITQSPTADQLAQAFGVSDVTIEGLKFKVPDEGVSAVLANGRIEIADSVIKKFSLKGLDFVSADDEITTTVGEAFFKGLDLSVDFASETSITENAARLYGITDIGIKDASFNNAGDKIGIKDFSLSEVAIESGMMVKGKTSIDGLRIPLKLISEMDRSTARTIGDITGAEDFVLSLSNSVDFDTEKGTFDTEIDFGAEGFAKVKIALGLAGLDIAKLSKASQLTDFFELMNLWGEISEDLKMASIKLEYADENLADTVLAKAPGTDQLVNMSGMQIDMVLGQYPEQAEELKAAISGFLNGKSGFIASATAQNPVGLMEMQSLYASGGLTDAVTFNFEGK